MAAQRCASGYLEEQIPRRKYDVSCQPQVEAKPGRPKEWRAKLEKWKCFVCGYIYKPEKGDAKRVVDPGTKFEDLPESWFCPVCGARKREFKKLA